MHCSHDLSGNPPEMLITKSETGTWMSVELSCFQRLTALTKCFFSHIFKYFHLLYSLYFLKMYLTFAGGFKMALDWSPEFVFRFDKNGHFCHCIDMAQGVQLNLGLHELVSNWIK
jgi:hypothetical protein